MRFSPVHTTMCLRGRITPLGCSLTTCFLQACAQQRRKAPMPFSHEEIESIVLKNDSQMKQWIRFAYDVPGSSRFDIALVGRMSELHSRWSDVYLIYRVKGSSRHVLHRIVRVNAEHEGAIDVFDVNYNPRKGRLTFKTQSRSGREKTHLEYIR